ncbi:hypothetical protein TARUN_8577 [Trichoderma arundinaceum]|uniref:Uncharacterized protein n=1 Tax=Trichoderma arundinaceum TaxID=490622 RepID=A0A395NC52_TRIAR|nr:hypothetical protein TARUN_8577 [Trichoderma arundinaceum]
MRGLWSIAAATLHVLAANAAVARHHPSQLFLNHIATRDAHSPTIPLTFRNTSPGKAIKPGIELRILPVGDSITYGFLSDQIGGDGDGYRLRLREDLSKDNVVFAGTETSPTGNMTDGYFAAWNGKTIQFIADHVGPSLEQRPNIILLHAGTNDMNPNSAISTEGHDPVAASERLGSLIDKMVTSCPDAVILVAMIIGTCNADQAPQSKVLQSLIPTVVASRLQAGKHVLAVDFSIFALTNLRDCIHPTNQGYHLVGDYWYDFISQIPQDWITKPVGKDSEGEESLAVRLDMNASLLGLMGLSLALMMPKEKGYNPVQAQRKADKAREIKKVKAASPLTSTVSSAGKAEAQGRRNEKLARKNPDRIQKQIDDLKAVTAGGGKLTRHEEQVLEGLERELKSVRKARDALGDKAPGFGGRGWRRDDDGSRSGALGKRRRGDGDGSSSDEDVPEDVRSIPMPRDTPPPIPKAEMDKWYAKRRARRNAENAARRGDDAAGDEAGDGQDNGKGKGTARTQRNAPPVVESRTVYEAKPVVRDLRKEAVSAFVPTSVQMKMNKGKGQGGLMEPEEADRLEKEGYLKLASGSGRGDGAEDGEEEEEAASSRHVMMEEVEDEEA